MNETKGDRIGSYGLYIGMSRFPKASMLMFVLVPYLVLCLGRPEVGRLALLLADVHPVAGVVLLHLHALHLLLDGFHGWRVEDGGWRWRMEDGAVLSPAVSRS